MYEQGKSLPLSSRKSAQSPQRNAPVYRVQSEINASSQEQASGIEQVNRAIVHMDGSTQSTAAQAEKLTGTSQSLAAQAQHLRGLISQFKFTGTPIASTMPAAAKPAAPAAPAKPAAATASKVVSADPKVQVLRPKRAASGNDDWTEF